MEYAGFQITNILKTPVNGIKQNCYIIDPFGLSFEIEPNDFGMSFETKFSRQVTWEL